MNDIRLNQDTLKKLKARGKINSGDTKNWVVIKPDDGLQLWDHLDKQTKLEATDYGEADPNQDDS